MTGTRLLPLLLAALALSILLSQPLCRAAHPQAHHASESTTCCANVGAATGAEALDQAIDGGAKPLGAAMAFIFFPAAVAFAVVTTRFMSAVAPPRSFYARSTRILR